MKAHLLSIFSIAALLIAPSAFAQSEATLAAERWFRRADADLNRTYTQLQSRLKSPRAKDELAKAQRAWIAFRDSDSAFRAGITSGGGSAYSMDYMGNQAELTEQRTKKLKTFLQHLP